MAGAAGFEPTHGRIKTCCLTAWRRPCSYWFQSREDLCNSGRHFTSALAFWEPLKQINFMENSYLFSNPCFVSVFVGFFTGRRVLSPGQAKSVAAAAEQNPALALGVNIERELPEHGIARVTLF